jgi:DNA-binding CsgD family transcriptional regulator
MRNVLDDDVGAASVALRFRKGAEADLAACIALLPAGCRMPNSVRQRLPALWRQLLAGEAHTFSIIEDMERPYPDGIEAFGLSIFVSERFFGTIELAARPQLASLIYEQMLAGERVMLDGRELAKGNGSSGLNLVPLHFGMRNEELANPRSAQAVATGAAAFHFAHAGYRIKAIANEVFGAQAAEFLARGGFRLMRNFQAERPRDFDDVPPAHYPFLFMLRREWVEPSGVNLLTQLFFAPAPRIRFSRGEQRVLELALLNETDPAVAALLGISQETVKKLWRNIFARVDRQAPYLMPADPASGSRLLGSRGREKRRHLLEYLRIHLEELRPVALPKTGKGR